jgi:hypothetical protein
MARDWRAFVGEIGIVVIGVLIALGADQAVKQWQQHQDVAAGREALRDDYVNMLVNARERQGLDGCLRRRLQSIASALNEDPDRSPGFGELGSPPARQWYPASWDSLVATQVTTHMPRTEMLGHASRARTAQILDERLVAELRAWSTLFTLVGAPRELASGEAANIRAALGEAMHLLNVTRLTAPQTERSIIDEGVMTAADMAVVERSTAARRAGFNFRASCGPMGRPVAQALTAPYDPAVQRSPLGLGQVGAPLRVLPAS